MFELDKNTSVILNYVRYYIYLQKEEQYKYANTAKTPVKNTEPNKQKRGKTIASRKT